ncbi:hypothetical protein H6G17_06920 [Chroococcidiopsis sp. FACHB-1243]|uniref:hypothetical protein n=1 Tax=Chroococcidiopsis sp. [FACHB-1243] TaxID=2692781 RepID=UPI00177DB143|nr:hypothetical protein [Chroococcidiopsis sp. [FACHB-1243]]MBD2305244.1 hypothetical protein [Chroococcidiopsis sp. [FACHB-1243]]
MLSEITLNPTLSAQTSEITFNQSLSAQMAECNVRACSIDRTEIDCYPYATRGVLFGILLGSSFWGAIAGVFMLLL